jgi:phage terminase large subunit-like protein
VARALGLPLMPWQQHVADVALEYDPATGLLDYREVDLSVPRQSGKTTELLTQTVLRATRFGPRQMVCYTAQSRKAALAKWRDEHVVMLDRSAFNKRGAYTVRKSNGSEAVLWRNGSMYGIDAPTEIAGHGPVLDLGQIDEAFSQGDDRVEQALAPSMVTRPSAQLWVSSTAGNARSRYWYRKVLAGREHVAEPSGTAFFEWSAADDDDPEDPAVWSRCMPALGWTVSEATIRAELARAKRTGKLDLFVRAYLNRWVEVPLLDQEVVKVIPLEAWDLCLDDSSKVVGDRVFAVDIAPDRLTAAIVVVGESSRGGVHVETVEHRPGAGTAWVLGRLVELVAKWPTRYVTAHLAGPVGSLEEPMRAAFGDRFRPVLDREVALACGSIFDGIHETTLRHVGDPSIRDALEGAAKSDRGDSWRWVRRRSTADISPLMAATIGWYVHALPVAVVESAYNERGMRVLG